MNTEYFRIVAFFAGAVILVIALLVVWNHMLKINVAQKTAELNAELDQRRRAEEALNRATRKLSILNAITFTDIQNALFSLTGYFELEKQQPADEKTQGYRQKQEMIIRTISSTLQFAKNYQDLGMKPPAWQDVSQVFALGISHIDSSHLSRNIQLDRLEIYSDPFLENVFDALAENVIIHGKTATEIVLRYEVTPDGLILIFEDNGTGIPEEKKEKIFERKIEGKNGMSLVPCPGDLSITGITIKETAGKEKGARFEMLVPKGEYRFAEKS